MDSVHLPGNGTVMSQNDEMTLTFRCPAELEGLIPPPVPAALALPDWLKAMPAQAFNALNQQETPTVKRCPPFLDAMTSGFLLPLICDLKVENGEFTWDNDLPAGGAVGFMRSPVGFHESSQVAGTPLFDGDRFLIKFHNLWTIQAPEGYALFFTHPVNRFDLPFTTLSGLVDCDRYHDNWIHFSGALARHEFQRCAAARHAGGAMHPGEAGEMGGADRGLHHRRRQACP
jgi:hypothetical protein